MKYDPKPIETFYNGYRFRSRLEARYAVFFDALGLEYRYEPEGYELPNGRRYLPDFKLAKSFVEIKGERPNDEYINNVLMMFGASPEYRIGVFVGEIGSEYVIWIESDGKSIYKADYARIHSFPRGYKIWEFASGVSLAFDEVRTAYTAARSARFEYGERGGRRVSSEVQAPQEAK